MEIIQITGFKNSGKTTLASELITMLKGLGYKVASLKHHGHGGIPLGMTDTDSEKLRQAGAFISGVEGDGVFQLSADSWDVEQMVAVYNLLNIEILVVEGFKKEPYPKIVLIQRKEEMKLLNEVENIKAIVSPLSIDIVDSVPVFNVKELDALCLWVIQKLIKK